MFFPKQSKFIELLDIELRRLISVIEADIQGQDEQLDEFFCYYFEHFIPFLEIY